MTHNRTSRGFTLIELLVVIAIIAILAGILFPVFARAKSQAVKTQCMSNMNQIGKGIAMYVDDYNYTIPLAHIKEDVNAWDNSWRERIFPYTRSKEILLCPVPIHLRWDWDLQRRPRKNVSHYGMNVFIAVYTAHDGWCKMSQIFRPAGIILISENYDGDWSAEPWHNEAGGTNTGKEGKFWPYHSDEDTKGGVFIFGDTHAKYVSVFETERDDFALWRNNP